MKLKLQIDDGEVVEIEQSVKVIYELEPGDCTESEDFPGEQLHGKFTTEGLALDRVSPEGEVLQEMVILFSDYFEARAKERKAQRGE